MTSPSSVLRLLTAAVCAVLAVAGCGVSGKPAAVTTTKPQTGPTLRPPTSASTTSQPASPPLRAWTTVVDPPTGLSFRLPKKPTLFKPAGTAADGTRVTARGYQAIVNDNLVVQVSIYDLAGRSFDPDKAIDGVVMSSRGTAIARSHVAADGIDIVDARIRIPGAALGYDRVFKIGDHAVQLWTLGLASDEAQIKLVQQRLSSTFRR